MQAEGLVELEHHSPVRVNNPFRFTRGPRGVQDPQRMLEGHLLVAGHGRALENLREPQRALWQGFHRPRRLLVNHDQLLHGGKHVQQARVGARHVPQRASEPVPVHHEQHRGLDLRKPVRNTGGPEVRVDHGPQRTHAGRGEQCHHGLRNVRQDTGHAVTAPHAEFPEPLRESGHAGLQLTPGPADGCTVLVLPDDRHLLGPGLRPAQRVLGIVEAGPWEPARTGHGPVLQRGSGLRRRHDPAVLPDRAPEGFEVLHRPCVEGIEALRRYAPCS